MKQLFGSTVRIMEQAIDLRTKRNTVLSANIANMDTPGYKAQDLPFNQVMAKYMNQQGNPADIAMRTTDARHFALDSQGKDPAAQDGLTLTRSTERGTPNDVDLDQEMAKLASNNLQYQATVQALIREFELLRTAITEGGRP